jgi:cell division septation protein DedD
VSQGNPKTGLLKSLWTGGYRHKIKEPVIAYRAEGSYPPADVQMDYAAQAGYRDEVVSSRGSNPAQGGGYVEIGVFTTEAKLDAAVSRLRKIGFPIATSDSTHGGRAVQRLRVGPYGSDMALTAALSAVQSSGYTQAYIR